jgi:hypothetical protein
MPAAKLQPIRAASAYEPQCSKLTIPPTIAIQSSPRVKSRSCKFCQGLSPPITVLSERKESTATVHLTMASNVFSHVLFCGSGHGIIFDLFLQKVAHPLLALGSMASGVRPPAKDIESERQLA